MAVLVLATGSAFAQERPKSVAVATECARLLDRLEPADRKLAPPRHDQIELIRAFLEHHPADAARVCVLKLRTRLGTLLLHAGELEAAREAFADVVKDVPPDQRDLPGQHDFLGRARYGQAQALELLDRPNEARALLEEIQAQHAGERYAKFARVALERLLPRKGVGPFAGLQAPPLNTEPLVDLDERQHSLRSYANRPVVLVFWSPAIESSISRLQSVAAGWTRAGGRLDTVLAIALSTSREAVVSAREKCRLAMPLIACDDEFLHPAALAYRVTKVPTVVLIGSNGTVLGRDLPVREIERVVGLAR
ncbi:MAG: hypothetical protein R3F56_15120 [Planctomycetota bacterium]